MSEGRFEAALWDLDGVIADTVEYHYQAWKDVFATKGVDFTMADFIRQFGQRHDTIIIDTLGDSVSTCRVRSGRGFDALLSHRAASHLRQGFRQDHLQADDGGNQERRRMDAAGVRTLEADIGGGELIT